ncbi:MAG: efflux RND transporter periplasmic adaptor subunit [Bacteroidaceae bacterium]|nr:efflux RND transporter periplasmic adaptor subunit [Bacteroidaceae bacterium]
MMKMKTKWMQLLGLFGCSVWLAACQQAPTQQMAGGAGYELMKVATSDKEFTTDYSAAIRGRYDASVLPQVSGTIQRVMVSEGQKVRKGQSLFIIDQVPYRAALNTASANVQAAKAGLATAQLSYDSAKELYAQKVISEHQLKTTENTLLTAKAQLAQAEAQEVNAKNSLAYTEVKSPSDGVVGAIPMREGTLVSPSMGAALTTVSDNKEMYVYFSMTGKQVLNMTRQYGSMEEALKNMPAVQLKLEDGSFYDQPGKIESISGVVDPQTGTISVRASFPNEGGILHSGFNGAVVIPSVYKDAIVIPQSATVQLQDKYLIYKVVDGKATSAIITVAPTSDGKEFVVLSGLEPGEEIIAKGAGLVREGTPVK